MADESLCDRPENWRCPECGHSQIVITARTCARIHVSDGEICLVDADESEPYWYHSDYAQCGCCDSGDEDCECEWGVGDEGTVRELEIAE